MEALVRHIVEPLVQNKDSVSIQVIEGDAAVMLEMVVHPDDRDRVEGEGGKTLRAIRTILNAAAGRQKATLDLVESHGLAFEE